MTRLRRHVMGAGGPEVLLAGLVAGRERTQRAKQQRPAAEPPANTVLPQLCPCGVVTAAGPKCRKCKRAEVQP